MKAFHKSLLLSAVALTLPIATSKAAELYPLFANPETDAGAGFGGVNYFASEPGVPFQLDTTALWEGNNIAVYTMDGLSNFTGAGFSVAVSNGENGIDSTEGGANLDVPNTEPVNPAILAVNGGNKLQNGNAIRLSVWMRQDPNDPVTTVPQIEPVLKIELWKEALSGNADFNPALFPGFGDRIWDTDQNAGQPLHQAAGQSQADWVDMNNSGTTSFGLPVSESLVTDEWRLVETTLVVDDDPLDDGFGWSIGSEFFTVADVEEIRGVLFMGDYAGTNLNDAGSMWVDNILMEIFVDEATMLATPNTNPIPMPEMQLLAGDFNNDGVVDLADYTTWRDNLGAAEGTLPNDPDGGPIGTAQYNTWKMNFGGAAAAPAIATASIPEPSSALLVAACTLMALAAKRSLTA